MALRGRFIAFVGFLAGLASTIGCSNVDYILNPQSKPSKPVDALVYADDLRDPKVDKKDTTPHEEYFEKLFPQFDLKGPSENLNKENILILFRCLFDLPYASIQNLPKYDLVLAMPSDKNKEIVDYKNLEQGGHCDYVNKEITFFRMDEETVYHELAHAFHLTYVDEKRAEKVKEIEEKWNNLETIIDGKKRKLKDIFGDEDLLGSYNKYGLATTWKDNIRESRFGFAKAYSANNIEEDIATMVEFIMKQNKVYNNDNYLVMNEKAQLLLELGCITKRAYDFWEIFNISKFGPLDKLLPHLKDKDESVVKSILRSFDVRDNELKYADYILPFLEHENDFTRELAVSYFTFCNDSVNQKYANEFLNLIKHKNKKIAENALLYFCVNDESKVYEKQVKDAVKRIGVDLTKIDTMIEFHVQNYLASKPKSQTQTKTKTK